VKYSISKRHTKVSCLPVFNMPLPNELLFKSGTKYTIGVKYNFTATEHEQLHQQLVSPDILCPLWHHTGNHFTALWTLSGTIQVSWYQNGYVASFSTK